MRRRSRGTSGFHSDPDAARLNFVNADGGTGTMALELERDTNRGSSHEGIHPPLREQVSAAALRGVRSPRRRRDCRPGHREHLESVLA